MDLNICISGAAGDGVKEAGELCGRLFSELGYEVFIYQEYQSIIRGGHNASVVRISDRKIHSHRKYYDLLICLEDYIYRIHAPFVRGDVIFDSKFQCEGIAIPMTRIVKEEHEPMIFRNAASIGALAAYFGIEFETVIEMFKERFGKKAKDDIVIARNAYDYYMEKYEPKMSIERNGPKRKLISGANAMADGMIKAGLEFYYAYPMTPASPVLHYLVRKKGVIAYQPESEISAVNMAIGSAIAGKRSATGTSGGGFALMCESIGLAGIAEIPLMIIEAQRTGPSTGIATYNGQEDLDFVLYPSHGEFPLIVGSPYTIGDGFRMAGELMNLAWKYQTPAILLTDKHLIESTETSEIDENAVIREDIEMQNFSDGMFKRYEITESGVSKYAIPPAIVKFNSNEHDEFGLTTDDAEIRRRMHEKRMKKEKMIEKDVKDIAWEEFFRGGDVIATWGSTFGALFEVAEELGYRLAVIRYFRPFIPPDFNKAVVVECNYTGQLSRMLREKAGVEIESVLKWDGRPFTPEELRERLG